MDFKTKRISRKKIRELARLIRKIFNECISPNGLYVDVIKMFELVPVAFPCITTAIVEDIKLGRIPGRCNPDYNGNYTVEIKESVYDGAVLGVGGFRTHIMHELAHAFMCIVGFTPICERSFKNYELKPYESMEWQAKALAGEILMEYELTEGMSIQELMFNCGVSEEGARNRFDRNLNGGDKNGNKKRIS